MSKQTKNQLEQQDEDTEFQNRLNAAFLEISGVMTKHELLFSPQLEASPYSIKAVLKFADARKTKSMAEEQMAPQMAPQQDQPLQPTGQENPSEVQDNVENTNPDNDERIKTEYGKEPTTADTEPTVIPGEDSGDSDEQDEEKYQEVK